ncbi:MAG: hypothetical protein ACKO23_16925 [Gemmataceae bacterium]
MLSRFVSSAAVLFVIAGFMVAGEYRGVITSHKDGKITVKYKKEKEDTEFSEKTFKVGKDATIVRKGKDGDTEVKAEDIAEMIEKASKGGGKGGNKGGGKGKGNRIPGLPAQIVTEGDGSAETVTKITIGGGGRNKKRDN